MENVAADLLEQYQDIINEYIKGEHGIYALYRKDRLYYVGLASNMRNRLKNHMRDRHKGLWDRFSVYLVRNVDHIKELESLVLRIVQPTGNRQLGKLPGSVNLKKELISSIRARHKQELNRLVGTSKQRQAKKKTKKNNRSNSNGTDDPPLKGAVKRRHRLRASKSGKEYKATLKPNGWILYKGYLYRTPSAAAKDACGSERNGWNFWQYQKTHGNWVPLGELR